MTDLFDVLDIGTREDSYTSLLAALLSEKPKWAREFFQKCTDAERLPPKPVTVNRWPHAAISGETVIPDLVLTFGDPASVVWVVEAKIKADEGKDQLMKQESDAARKSLTENLNLLKNAAWHYSYLTLEGEPPADAAKFQPASFEPLREVFTKKPSLSEEVYPAYETLRKRLRDYYRELSKEPNDYITLREHLDDVHGLISRKSRFHRLGQCIARDLNLEPEFGTANNPGGASHLFQMRERSWVGDYYSGNSGSLLQDCYDVHLECQLDAESVRLLLHYESRPYMEGLKNKVESNQYEKYRESREKFGKRLNDHRTSLDKCGWGTIIPNFANQLTRIANNIPLDLQVGEFRKHVQEASKAMRSAVNDALDEG